MTGVLVVLITAGLGEVLARVLVPEHTFWPIASFYRTSDIPGLHYTYEPGFEGIGYGVPLSINRLGFRGPEWSEKKTPGHWRVALLGDSHAFGFGVPFEDSVGEVLARELTRRYGVPVEVLGFGVAGYNSFQQKAVLDRIALGFEPDMVVIVPCVNDNEPAMKVDEAGYLHVDGDLSNEDSRLLDKSIDLVESNVEPPPWWLTESRLLLYLQLTRERYRLQREAQEMRQGKEDPREHWMAPLPKVPEAEVDPRLEKTLYVPLGAMLSTLNERDIPVVMAPFAGRLNYRRLFQELGVEHDVPVVELLALLPEARSWPETASKFGLGWDDHLNAVAHERFAVGIADAAEQRGYGATLRE